MSHILIDHLTQAASFYRGQLRASTRAVAYLKSRGLRGDIAARYGLGYARPASRRCARHSRTTTTEPWRKPGWWPSTMAAGAMTASATASCSPSSMTPAA
nr:hypothetical protein [Pandoraea pnomenusa]